MKKAAPTWMAVVYLGGAGAAALAAGVGGLAIAASEQKWRSEVMFVSLKGRCC